MTRTYTIAYDEDGYLYACIPDGVDLEAALAYEESQAQIEIDRDSLKIESGLFLVDDTEEGDDVFGFDFGTLSDENGVSFAYAVRRA